MNLGGSWLLFGDFQDTVAKLNVVSAWATLFSFSQIIGAIIVFVSYYFLLNITFLNPNDKVKRVKR
jgi:hypothetical protein